MVKTTPTCRRCDVKLDSANWYPSCKVRNDYICKQCLLAKTKEWYHAHPGIAKVHNMRSNRKHGIKPMSENRECSIFLGIHVAERVLSKVFKHVERMPINNHGYDFVCGKGYRVDVKSSCILRGNQWMFHVVKNTIADYFLCIAFDNREQLTPLHVWLIPGKAVNHLQGASISKSTIPKWDEYKLDISKVVKCCDTMKK